MLINVNDNWLYSGLEEWTIDELQNMGAGHGSAGCISSNGDIDIAYVGNFYDTGLGANISGKYLAVRPTFYLDNNVKLSKGNGTEDNPYRLSV